LEEVLSVCDICDGVFKFEFKPESFIGCVFDGVEIKSTFKFEGDLSVCNGDFCNGVFKFEFKPESFIGCIFDGVFKFVFKFLSIIGCVF